MLTAWKPCHVAPVSVLGAARSRAGDDFLRRYFCTRLVRQRVPTLEDPQRQLKTIPGPCYPLNQDSLESTFGHTVRQNTKKKEIYRRKMDLGHFWLGSNPNPPTCSNLRGVAVV